MKLFYSVCLLIILGSVAFSQQTDTTTGRCSWINPSNNEKLICPEEYPNCSKYQGVCYQVVNNQVVACQWKYMAWGGVHQYCEDFLSSTPEPVPTTTPDPLPSTVPTYDENLKCASGFSQLKYNYVNDQVGAEEARSNLEEINIRSDETNKYSIINCESLRTDIDGEYNFRVNAKDGVKIILDENVIFEEWKDKEPEAAPKNIKVTITHGFHTLQVLTYNHQAPHMVFVDWQLIKKVECFGFDYPEPEFNTEWISGSLTHKRYNLFKNNYELGELIDETPVSKIYLKDTTGEANNFGHVFEGDVLVGTKGMYDIKAGSNGYIDLYVNDGLFNHVYINGLEHSDGIPGFAEDSIYLKEGLNHIKLVFKPTASCSMVYFNVKIPETTSSEESGGCFMAGSNYFNSLLAFLLMLCSMVFIRRRNS